MGTDKSGQSARRATVPDFPIEVKASMPFLSALRSSYLIHPRSRLVLEECLRVLNQGGRLGVVAMLKTEHPGRMVRLYEWFHDHFPAYADCRPIDASAQIQAAGFWIEE